MPYEPPLTNDSKAQFCIAPAEIPPWRRVCNDGVHVNDAPQAVARLSERLQHRATNETRPALANQIKNGQAQRRLEVAETSV